MALDKIIERIEEDYNRYYEIYDNFTLEEYVESVLEDYL